MRTKSAKTTIPDGSSTTVDIAAAPRQTTTARKSAVPEAVITSSPLRLWKDGTRRGIAYVEGREMAERVLAATGRTVAPPVRIGRAEDIEMPGTMAVYRDKRGRAFAWQIPFDIRCWDSVASLAPIAPSITFAD